MYIQQLDSFPWRWWRGAGIVVVGWWRGIGIVVVGWWRGTGIVVVGWWTGVLHRKSGGVVTGRESKRKLRKVKTHNRAKERVHLSRYLFNYILT